MKKHHFLIPMVVFFSAALRPEQASATYSTTQPHKEGELIVHFKSSANANARRRAISRHAHAKLANVGSDNVAHVRLSAGESVQSAMRAYENDPNVEFVQPNYVYSVFTTTPNDPLFAQQWGLKNTGQAVVATAGGPGTPDSTNSQPNGGTSGDDMSMTGAWDIANDCSSVIVAVVDTGVNYNQEDLSGSMWPTNGKDFVGTGSAGGMNPPLDQNGHGTHVAGIIGAQGDNGVGGTGVCWRAQIMAIRVLDASGSGTTVDIVNGLNFAIANGAQIINMSLGGSSYDATFSAALTSAKSHGIVVVAAAGNSATNVDNGSPSYPCSYGHTNVICVAALNQSYGLAYYSNYGVTSVDVGAPGSNIVSTWAGTNATLTDPLTSWTTTGAWGYPTASLRSLTSPYAVSTVNLLANPANWNLSHTYSATADDKSYKDFAIGAVDVASVTFGSFVDLAGTGTLEMNYIAGGGDPFGMSGVQVFSSVGAVSSGGSATANSYDISPCTTPCGLGFHLTGDTSTSSFGAAFFSFSINTLAYATNVYNVIEGTSMAAPMVTGVAALVKAYNPNATYAQVINAVKNSGVALSSLSGKTSTGRAVNGWNALTYINAPVVTSLTAF